MMVALQPLRLARNLVALASCLIAMLVCGNAAASSEPLAGLEPGRHDVGFRIVDTADAARSFPLDTGGTGPRPMRLYVWYPSAGPPGAQVTVSDLLAESFAFRVAPESPQAFYRGQLTPSIVNNVRDADRILSLPMRATRDAEEASGRFPLILMPPGAPAGLALSAESLASHGFVVIGMAARAHRTVETLDFTPDLPSIENGVNDMEFALATARGMPNVDADRVGVLAFSSTTLTGLAFTFRTAVPSAVVSIEGWEGRQPGVPLINEYRHYDPAGFRAAYLLMETADANAPGFVKTPVIVDALSAAPRWRIAFAGAGHADFSFPEGIRPNSSGTVRRVFEAANDYMLAFFQAHLGDSSEASWPPPPEAGVEVVFSPSLGRGIGQEEFFRLAEIDPEAALALARQLAAEARVPPFGERSITRLAILAARPDDAITLLEIVRVGYPASAAAAGRLSDYLWANQRTDEARAVAATALGLVEGDATLSDPQREGLRDRMTARIQEN